MTDPGAWSPLSITVAARPHALGPAASRCASLRARTPVAVVRSNRADRRGIARHDQADPLALLSRGSRARVLRHRDGRNAPSRPAFCPFVSARLARVPLGGMGGSADHGRGNLRRGSGRRRHARLLRSSHGVWRCRRDVKSKEPTRPLSSAAKASAPKAGPLLSPLRCRAKPDHA